MAENSDIAELINSLKSAELGETATEQMENAINDVENSALNPFRNFSAIAEFMKLHPFESARADLNKIGIRCHYDDEVAIFSAKPRHAKWDFYAQEANGLILRRSDWSILVYPPKRLRHDLDTPKCQRFLEHKYYQIYKAFDGTTISVYKFKDEWRISTTSGYDMAAIRWNGGATYKEMVCDCLEKVGLDWELFTSQLNPECCHTFNFKHPAIHEFQHSDMLKIYHIQSVFLNPKNPDYLWASEQCDIALIESPTQCSTFDSLNSIYAQVAGAWEKYKATGEVLYGYIFRSINQKETGEYSSLYIESTLARRIRTTLYDNYIQRELNEFNVSKKKLIATRGYLSKYRDEFLKLLPQYADEIDKIDNFINSCVKEMVAGIKDIDAVKSGVEKNIHILIATLYLHMFEKLPYKITAKDNAEKIYKEFMISKTEETMRILLKYYV